MCPSKNGLRDTRRDSSKRTSTVLCLHCNAYTACVDSLFLYCYSFMCHVGRSCSDAFKYYNKQAWWKIFDKLTIVIKFIIFKDSIYVQLVKNDNCQQNNNNHNNNHNHNHNLSTITWILEILWEYQTFIHMT